MVHFLTIVIRTAELPAKLVEIATDPAVLKIGVNIRNDAAKLYKDFNVEAVSLFELSKAAHIVDSAFWTGRDPALCIALQHLTAKVRTIAVARSVQSVLM